VSVPKSFLFEVVTLVGFLFSGSFTWSYCSVWWLRRVIQTCSDVSSYYLASGGVDYLKRKREA